MKKGLNRQDRISQKVYMEFSVGMNGPEYEQVVRDVLSSLVKHSISKTRKYRSRGISLDTSIGVTLELNNSDAWIELWQRAHKLEVECDNALECKYPRSAQFCYTKNYKNCPGYAPPAKKVKYPIGVTFKAKR
jgi:hypothetical protein